MKKIYYFDKITINTELEKEDLSNLLPLKKLRKHCYGKIEINEASNTAKYHGYRTRIDAHQATDEFIQLLSKYDLGKYGIWHFEIAKDTEYETWEEAEKYLFWIERNVHRKWSRSNWCFQGKVNDTLYLSLRTGKGSRNYTRVYVTDKKILKSPSLHLEFTLEGNGNVNKVLGIKHFSELKTAQELFDMLERRYLSFPTINRKKLEELFWHIWRRDRTKAKYCASMVKDVQELREWIESRQENIKTAILMRKSHRRSKQSKRKCEFINRLKTIQVKNISKRERYILNAKLRDFLIFTQ